MAPAHTPPAVLDKLARGINEAIRTPDVVAKLAAQGGEPAGTSPREFAAFLKSERERWQALAAEVKITVGLNPNAQQRSCWHGALLA